MSSRVDLLVELGCEEIPARMLAGAAADLARIVVEALDRASLAHGAAREFWTPRRLAVLVAQCAATTPEREELLLGPPASAAWDAGGLPTRAAEGFARKHGRSGADLERVPGERGEYAALRVRRGGQPLGAIVAADLPAAIARMTSPKTMRWGDGEQRFVRPVHWVVALAGAEVVPLVVFGVPADRRTAGHRALAPGLHDVASAGEWEAVLEGAGVVADPARRRATLREALARASAEFGASLVDDEELLDESVGIVEFPGVQRGSFDERFVRELPAEVLRTCLKHHQKAFSLARDGAAAPGFAVAVNRPDDPEGHVRRGHEWVVSGRLEDALFFWSEDRKRPLAARLPQLAGVVFQKELGTYAAKTVRVTALARELAVRAGLDGQQQAWAERAALLARCDLVTGLVGEFPELQGVAGGLFARADGEDAPVCRAVYQLYVPASADGPLPDGDLARLLGLADRIDTLAGCFAVGVVPSGSRDPFSLRRAGTVAVRLARHLPWLDLAWLARRALEGYAGGDAGADLRARAGEAVPALLEFLFERFAAVAGRWIPGARYDEIAAVRAFASGSFVVADLYARVEALARFRASEDFYALAAASKRIRNILAQAAERGEAVAPGAAQESAPREAEERELAAAVAGTDLAAFASYEEKLAALARLRPAVDRFFDRVLVMDPDTALRRARLGLLARLSELTRGVVDMSEIVVEGAKGQAAPAPEVPE
ncbi:MAG: glycine--tRNA ligase subunit beta [Acidobacteria bacterium]|nr:glycine--tRNA ligase subunit beta [Acidobacteriota bacterium]